MTPARAVWLSITVLFATQAHCGPLAVPRAVRELVPPPQRCHDKGEFFSVDGHRWAIVVNRSVSADAFTATRLQAELLQSLRLNLTIVDLAKSPIPQVGYLAFGDPAVSPALGQLAAQRNLGAKLARLSGQPEGYVLDTAATGVLGLGSTGSAVFFASVTAAQLINATANPGPGKHDTYRTPAVTITDWPDVGMRGYTLQGLRATVKERPVPSPFFYRQVDMLSRFKMNLCYAAFEDSILVSPDAHADMILGIADYCTDLHLLYIPTMAAGAKVGALDGRTGEGVWVRNASFTVPIPLHYRRLSSHCNLSFHNMIIGNDTLALHGLGGHCWHFQAGRGAFLACGGF